MKLHRNHSTHPRAVFLTALMLFLLIVLVTPGSGQDGTGPVAPPLEVTPLPTLPAPAFHAAEAVQAECTNCSYLPFVTNTIAGRTREEALELYRSLYLPGTNIDSEWTGDVSTCNPGTTSDAYLDAIKKRINYFREMAGLADITLNADYNRKAQAEAVMVSAKNAFDGTPIENWPCYTAEAGESYKNTNKYLHVSGPIAIDGYISNPGYYSLGVKSRRWVLLPQISIMGTGNIPTNDILASSILWVKDPSYQAARPETAYPFVAWPPPGYVPYKTVYARWSFAIKNADFSQSTVTVTKDGITQPVTVFTPEINYLENTLVWQPTGMDSYWPWVRPQSEETYVVEIRNVNVSGVMQTYRYPVTIFDPGQ